MTSYVSNLLFPDTVSEMTRANLLSIVALVALGGTLVTLVVTGEPRHFKLGLLIPWTDTDTPYSGQTSASAVSLAIDAVNNNTVLGANMRLT